MQPKASLVLFPMALAFLAGCGHAPVKGETDPRALLGHACGPGAGVRSAKGSVWLKAQSKEASGQFPATVDVSSPEKMKMEVTNLVGGTEAVISVDGRNYSIDVPHRKDRSQKGSDSWGGIPLQWANTLFLGRVPCPEPSLLKDAALSVGGDGELIVETPKSLERLPEKFVYRFRSVESAPWAEALHWERAGLNASDPLTVDFKFEEPEAKTRSPKKWEAKGSQGEVKVRWRDRQVQAAR